MIYSRNHEKKNKLHIDENRKNKIDLSDAMNHLPEHSKTCPSAKGKHKGKE